MTSYLIKRILRSLLSVVIVVGIVMVLIYSCLDKTTIFQSDPVFSKKKSNAKEVYMMQQWERYGYLDYVPYADWMQQQLKDGKIDQAAYDAAIRFGNDASKDSEAAAAMVAKFTEDMESKGYKVRRLPADTKGKSNTYKDGGQPQLFAQKDIPLTTRLGRYFKNLITVDNIHNAAGIPDEERGLSFTLYDPVYGGKKFSPAIMGNGTTHKYLLYFTDEFPYIHQNLVNINLGESYTINKGMDVFKAMTKSQGSFEYSTVTYPTGLVEKTASDLHSATYVQGSLVTGGTFNATRFTDDYTNLSVNEEGLSKLGYSFVIGILSVLLSYLIGIPLGTIMALQKDKLVDKLGTLYIVFIIAVPSLAYIFMFKSIGDMVGLPTTFNMENPTRLMYLLPVVSLALPSIANLMKWLRRYMIDQMNSDYVKFARSGGLSEGEIFTKHVLKNAIIPIVHGIPGAVLGSLVGAIITERVYVVPGAGNLLTQAIGAYDNGAIVGVTLFYALISVISIILGDILISLVDPRISFTAKGR